MFYNLGARLDCAVTQADVGLRCLQLPEGGSLYGVAHVIISGFEMDR